MSILLLLVCLVGMVIFIILWRNTKGHEYKFTPHELFGGLAWVFGITSFGLILAIICLSTQVATVHTIDAKIIMYQEENAAIEQDIDRIVDAYLMHEQNTYSDLKTDESSITLVTLFPELKSDALVQQQLEIYVANNEKIKSLKEERINTDKLKWLLYFGK